MKKLFKLSVLTFLIPAMLVTISGTSCYGQKMVRKVSDAKKLETNQEQFIGKPLKTLLEDIGLTIKFVYGNPENTWAGATGGTYLKFHFVDRNEYGKMRVKNEAPTAIIVNFQLEPKNTRKPLPKEGLKEWTAEDTKEYGDMIITKIRVVDEN